MRAPHLPLPPAADVDVAKLARAFNDATQCYKFLFFRALLDRVAQTGEPQIALADILAGMIEAAWWPVQHYRLTIGVGQTNHIMRELVDSMAQEADERLGLTDVRTFAAKKAIGAKAGHGVLRYVPTRLLSPWYGPINGDRDDKIIIKLSSDEAERLNLPYRFIDKGARLPRPGAIEKLAAFHSRAIDIAQRGHVTNWTRFSEEYATDLRLDLPDIRQPDRLADAYRCTIGPLLAMATRMGFPAGWP